MNHFSLLLFSLLSSFHAEAATFETFYQCYGLDKTPTTGVKVDPNSKPQTIGTANGAKVEMYAESTEVIVLKVVAEKLTVATKSNNGPLHLRIEKDQKITSIDCPKITVSK